jgi:NAD(P)-dependent dehydrogenase (short-subunit alcohol dehydrogenase family)
MQGNHNYLKNTKIKKGYKMNNKNVIITGANSGIGKAAAVKFSKEGYTVIMACRNIERSEKVRTEIIDNSNNKNVDLLQLDISSFTSIQDFCKAFSEKYKQLDILIHNAASFNFGTKEYQFSNQGIELTFAANVFGPLLMNYLLKDLLVKSENPKILNASTINIKWFNNPRRKIDFDNLQGEFKDSKPYSVYKLYGDSKMSFTMQTFRLAKEFEKENINVNALLIPDIKHSKSSLKKMGFMTRLIGTLMNPFLPKPEIIAEKYFELTTAEKFDDINGELIDHKGKIIKAPKFAYIQSNIEQNWDYSKRIIETHLN